MRNEHRQLKMIYVLSRFPCRSELFILREIRGQIQLGAAIHVVVIGDLDFDPVGDDGANMVKVWRRPSWLNARLWMTYLADSLCHPRSSWRTLATARSICRRERQDKRFLALRLAALSAYFRNRLRPFAFDLIHAHFANRPATFACLLSQILDCPWGFSAHARDVYAESPDLVTKARSARHILACSHELARWLRSRVGSPNRERIRCSCHGLDLDEWCPDRRGLSSTLEEPKNPPKDPPSILAVGRLEPKKGFSVLIRACRVLRESNFPIRARIVGEGPERRGLVDLIRSLDVADQVEITPWISNEKLRDLYEESTVLVAPSRVASDGDRDTIPNVVVEALAMGLPIIASAIPSIKQLLSPAQAARLVPMDDPEELAVAIREVTSDKDQASRLRQAGRKLIEDSFDLNTTSEELREIFLESAAQCAAPPSLHRKKLA